MKKKGTVLYRAAKATKTRQDILAVAADIASAEGLEGLSIGRLAAELKMSKTGIFAHFGSREELQIATVNQAKEVFLRHVAQPALAQPRGLKRLKTMLSSWLHYVEQGVFRGGCFFAAASLEFDSRPGRVRDDVSALTKAWMDALRNEISRAKAQREIVPATVPAQLAFELHAYVQEANWAYKLFNDRKAFSRARTATAAAMRYVSREHQPNSNREEPNREATNSR
ncbi:MAG TPA: TetR/AcrR family transcriptional regulator [Candidatus Angelobacter sp.]